MSTYTLHQSCLHSPQGPLPPDSKIDTSLIPGPKNLGVSLQIVLHPTWCKVCTVERIRALDAIAIHVEPGVGIGVGTLCSEQLQQEKVEVKKEEEQAFEEGVRFGRRAAIVLDSSMDAGRVLQAVMDWNPYAPECDPCDLFSTMNHILRGTDPKFNMLLDIWHRWRESGLPIQLYPGDNSRLAESLKVARLSAPQKLLVQGIIERYREGQWKGVYWQWRVESRAWWEGDVGRRRELFEVALGGRVPRFD